MKKTLAGLLCVSAFIILSGIISVDIGVILNNLDILDDYYTFIVFEVSIGLIAIGLGLISLCTGCMLCQRDSKLYLFPSHFTEDDSDA